MSRALLFCAAMALLGPTGRAEEAGARPETLIRLEIRPAAAPVPALRYQLLPDLGEMNPGNPVLHYFKCCLEQEAFLFDRGGFDRREALLAMPLKELPARDLQDYGRSVLAQADYAARLDHPDWQILTRLKIDGVATLLPDVQQLRGLARALAVRFRAEIALGRFDDAIRTAKTMLAIARHLGEHPTLIGNLVGIAIANIALEPLQEMLGQPGCPNLYWALTNLPDPLIALDRGFDGERVIVVAEFRDLDDTGPIGAEQLKKFIAHVDDLLKMEEPLKSSGGLRKWLDARNKDEAKLEAARRRLVEVGLPEERVRRFTADQVILLDEKREYEVRRDDEMKTAKLPYWQAEPPAPEPSKKPTALFADTLLSFTRAVRLARGRTEQRVALLRHVEALRLHAAEHGGKLPATLAEVAVPLPVDPFTGKPFRYEVIGSTAHLRGTPPRGEEKQAVYNLHFELNLQK